MKRMFNFSSSFKICLKSNIHNSLALKGKKVEKLLIYHRVTGQVFFDKSVCISSCSALSVFLEITEFHQSS